MKRTALILFLLALLIAGQPFIAQADGQEPISVLIDDLKLNTEVAPVIYNDRALVPFRAIAEAMNIEVRWDELTRTVYAAKDGTKVALQIDNPVAILSDKRIPLDTAPGIVEGRTMIPLRFFSEAFGCQVNWDSSRGRINITTPPRIMTVIGFYALGDSQTSSWTDLFGKSYPEMAAGHTKTLSTLSLGWYSLDRQGNLLDESRSGWQRPPGWEKVLAGAKQYNLECEMVIHITDGDRTISELLKDTQAMERAVKAIGAEVRHYKGVNLDFEGLGYNDRGAELMQVQQRFTAFVELLAQELNGKAAITLTLHAPNSAYPGYDYRALGELCDQIIIMAYDYGPKPEPASQVIEAVEMACRAVPADKLILGISAPSETVESIAGKVGIAKRYNLKGVALWRLGLISDEMWGELNNALIARQ